MRMDTARAAARDWITSSGRKTPGYLGVYISGSTTGLADDADLPLGSDLDIMLITRSPVEGHKLGKFIHEGVLLEVTYLPWSRIAPADAALADYHVAGGLRSGQLVDDPTGALASLRSEVADRFCHPELVRARCQGVRDKIESGLRALDSSLPWHQQVTNWLFPTGVTAHLILVAAQRNPTVRLRYLRAREVLDLHGLGEEYPNMLALMGADRLTPQQVSSHVDGLEPLFDAAVEHSRSAFFFSSDITAAARPIAIDASRQLIADGNHREAMFWITATYARCHAILAADAPHVHASFAPQFDQVMASLGVTGSISLRTSADATLAALPHLWDLAQKIAAES